MGYLNPHFPQTIWIYSNLIHFYSYSNHHPIEMFNLVFDLQRSHFASSQRIVISLHLIVIVCHSSASVMFSNDIALHNFKVLPKYTTLDLSSPYWDTTWFFHHSPNVLHFIVWYLRSFEGYPILEIPTLGDIPSLESI